MVDEGADRSPGLLLDTNIVIAVLKQEDAALARLQEAVGSFFVSVITLGENETSDGPELAATG